MTSGNDAWPALPLEAWQDTHATLHLWLQIVGKVRLTQTPWLNHCWHVTLYVTPSGLTTGAMPHGERSFRIDFDFLRQRLAVRTSDGGIEELPLAPQTVATFYARLMSALDKLRVPVHIYAVPNEIPEAIPFAADDVHRAYDGEFAQRYPRGYAAAKVAPDAASFSKDYGEFILPYDAVRTSASPDATLMAFLQSTYDAAADLARWDRHALERPADFVRPDGRAS